MKTTTIEKTRIANWRKRLALASARNESGAALVVALLLLVVIAVAVPVAMTMTSQDFGRTTKYTDSRDLFYLAEAGLEHGKSLIKAGNINSILAGPDGDKTTLGDNGTVAGVGDTADATPYVWNGVPYDDVAFGDGTYYFRVYDNDDGDGDLYANADNLVFIEGVGVNANGDTKTLRSMVRRHNMAIPGAVSFLGPVTELEVEGNQFNIQGAHSSSGYSDGFFIDGTRDASCPGKPGIATQSAGPAFYEYDTTPNVNCPPGHPTCIELESGAGPNIQGVGGTTPSVTTGQTTFTQSYAQELWGVLTAPGVPDYTSVTNGGTYGTTTDPAIVHLPGDFALDGLTISGVGILIIDNDGESFEMNSGSINWDGIVMLGVCPACVTEELEFEGASTLNINGSLVVGGATEEIEFEGFSNIRYSCEAIALANSVLDFTFKVIDWNEVS